MSRIYCFILGVALILGAIAIVATPVVFPKYTPGPWNPLVSCIMAFVGIRLIVWQHRR